MAQLTFEKEGGMNVCSFTPSEAGVLIINRAESGLIRVSIKTENTECVAVDTDDAKDYVIGINYTGISVLVESEPDVVKAEYSGGIITPND